MQQQAQLLLIEDDYALASGIIEYLQSQLINIQHAATASAALLATGPFDLILCDIMLPDGDGFALLPRLQSRHACPVLFLTALSNADDQIRGLEAGVTDYLCKPIDPALLLAKIRSCLRAHRRDNSQPIVLHDLIIDRSINRATLAGRCLGLTALEFDILSFFALRAGQIISRETLFQHLVGREYDGLDRAIDVRISRLRKHLEQLNVQGLAIVTVRGQGYLFNYLKSPSAVSASDADNAPDRPVNPTRD